MIDKALSVVAALESSPASLVELVERTGLSRATAHRLAAALEVHDLVRRDGDGRYALGLRWVAVGHRAAAGVPMAELAGPHLTRLRDQTGESAQLYVRDGDRRVCVAAVESPHGLRTIVAVGASLPLDVGSAGRVLVGEAVPSGWLATVEEREPGVASVSAPVHGPGGSVVAAVSVSGPIDRTTRNPGPLYGAAVVLAAQAIEAEAFMATTP